MFVIWMWMRRKLYQDGDAGTLLYPTPGVVLTGKGACPELQSPLSLSHNRLAEQVGSDIKAE